MNDLDTDSVQSAIAELKAKGYGVRRTPGPCQREASYAFVLSRPMMATALFGPARSSVFAAWASAQEHAEQGETAASKQRLAPFYAAELPSSAFDASAIAQRFGVDVESAERQVQQLRCQSIFLSETYQVNVQLLRHPFGPNLGDVAWLSIKRRDREVVRDWRELQAIKARGFSSRTRSSGPSTKGSSSTPPSPGWSTPRTSSTSSCSWTRRCACPWASWSGR